MAFITVMISLMLFKSQPSLWFLSLVVFGSSGNGIHVAGLVMTIILNYLFLFVFYLLYWLLA